MEDVSDCGAVTVRDRDDPVAGGDDLYHRGKRGDWFMRKGRRGICISCLLGRTVIGHVI